MIRTAISPRLATRTRRNGGPPASSLRKDGTIAVSERDVAMLLPRVRVALVSQHLEGPDDPRPRLGRTDYVVDVAAGRGDVRVVDLLLVPGHEPSALGGRVVGVRDLVLEDDVHRALGAHDRDLGRRPGEVHIATDVLAAHDVVGATVGLAGDDGDLRDRRLAIGIQQLRSVLDDPAVLLPHPGQEARYVDEGDQRDVEAVAGPDEPRCLVRGVDARRAREHRRLRGNDADAPAREAAVADDDVGSPTRLDLEEPGWASNIII